MRTRTLWNYTREQWENVDEDAFPIDRIYEFMPQIREAIDLYESLCSQIGDDITNDDIVYSHVHALDIVLMSVIDVTEM